MKIFQKSFWLMSLGAILLAACGPLTQRDGLRFEGGWVRAIPPGMNMTAGYGSLVNQGSEPMVITAFSSDAFGEVSLHRTERVDGVSRMREVLELTIPAGETVALEPGGLHLMLMEPAGGIAEGRSVTVELTAADGRRYRFELPVERR